MMSGPGVSVGRGLRALATLSVVCLLTVGCRSDAGSSLAPAPAPEIDTSFWSSADDATREAAARAALRDREDLTWGGLLRVGVDAAPVAVFRHDPTGLEFVLVPAGEFVMGDPEAKIRPVSATGRGAPDHAAHRVRISRPFLICRTEMTRAALQRLRPGEPGTSAGSPNEPVVDVTWAEARAICGEMGMGLPTEAQWEYASDNDASARSDSVQWIVGTGNISDTARRRFDMAPDKVAWGGRGPEYVEELDDGFAGLAPVGSYHPNRHGLFDMIGNAAEWCLDAYGAYPRDEEIVVDPVHDVADADYRVARGGSWKGGARYAQSFYRHAVGARGGHSHVGFRPIVEIRSSDDRAR